MDTGFCFMTMIPYPTFFWQIDNILGMVWHAQNLDINVPENIYMKILLQKPKWYAVMYLKLHLYQLTPKQICHTDTLRGKWCYNKMYFCCLHSSL